MTHPLLPFSLPHTPLALAPMAGITDNPTRRTARQWGADWTVSEMLSSDPGLQHTQKSRNRRNHEGEDGVIVVQIAGSDPEQMAHAARHNAEHGAQIIDTNMGCPVKKVCNVLAGSALLQNEPLVERILHAVVRNAGVPVTLKTRLGWDDEHRNILTIAKMAEQAGIAALAIHGRTRTQMYQGNAEYDLIAQVKHTVSLPVWVNGDIDSPQKAARVLQQTQADGVMVGRAAQGQPWIFRDIAQFLQHGRIPEAPAFDEAADTVLAHIAALHRFYGDTAGTRIARKHIAWYLRRLADGESCRKHINQISSAAEQYDTLAQFLQRQKALYTHWPRDYAS